MATMWAVLGVLVGLWCAAAGSQQPCAPRSYGQHRIVCVCNATYCDTVEAVTPLPSGRYLHVTSSRDGLRFRRQEGVFGEGVSLGSVLFHVDVNRTFQNIYGFGGAFTDAVGINIRSLSKAAQDRFIGSYFSAEGLEYNMARVPIAGTDFSNQTYTYDDVPGDTTLRHFNLTTEDTELKIPLIKEAQAVRQKDLLLLGAAWSAPPWMKTNDDYSGFGFLKEEYYQPWADYLLRFLDAYAAEGLRFWAVSTGNEPSNGIVPVNRFNSMGWTPASQRVWVKDNLGPTLRGSEHRDVRLLALDDQRFMLPWWPDQLMSDKDVATYIDGVAVHWYWDTLLPPSLLDATHRRHPDKFLIATEACVGDKPWQFQKVKLGAWERGEDYMDDIIQDLSHWVTGWIDWNLALDERGGPNWAGNFVDSAVIVNASADEFYKQPMFYAIGHFSKFVVEGSVRVHLEPASAHGVKGVGFLGSDGRVTVVLHNGRDSDKWVTVSDSRRGSFSVQLPRRSFSSLVYW